MSSSAAARPRQNSKTSEALTSPVSIRAACSAAVRLRSSSLTRLPEIGTRKPLVGGVRRLLERDLAVEARTRHVLAKHVGEVDDVRRRLDSVEIELVHRLHVLEDLGQLAGHPVDLVVAEPQSRELGHVQHLVPVDHGRDCRLCPWGDGWSVT